MVKRYTHHQFLTLSNFFETLAAGWFSAGIIAPYFTYASINERIVYSFIGLMFAYMFLTFSLFFSREVDR